VEHSLIVLVLLVQMISARGRVDPAHQEPERRPQPLQELMRMEVVYPQEKAEWQATLISDYQKFEDGNSFSVPVAVEYGLTDAWQVGVEWLPYTRVRSADGTTSGRGGVALESKYSFMNIHGSAVHAAAGIDLELQRGPATDGGVENGHEVETFGAVALDWGKRVSLFAHVGVIAARTAPEEGEPDGRLTWSTGELIALPKATLAVELNFINNRGFRRGTGGTYLTPSVTVHPHSGWEMAVGVPIGLTTRSNAFGVIGHLIYER
jgi:hypothetical protein